MIHMSRWPTDGVFYRVVCVTLLAVAIVFSLILTDVFLDIDGLLHAKKDKIPRQQITYNDRREEFITTELTDTYNTETNVGVDNSYRTKRSSESEIFLNHIKQTKVRNLLTNRLASLLDQLDAEQTTVLNDMGKTNDGIKEHKELIREKETKQKMEERERFLHSAMHEILLLALKGHMDFNEVYQRIHTLMENFNKANQDKEVKSQKTNPDLTKENTKQHSDSANEERKIFDELIHCDKLKTDIAKDAVKIDKETRRQNHGPKIIIKTIIDINSITDKWKGDNETNSPENVKGLVKLIYNGKSIKFTRLDDEDTQAKIKESNPKLDAEVANKEPLKYDEITDLLSRYTSHTKTNDFIKEYLHQYTSDKQHTKRLKRHIKIRYEKDGVTEQPKTRKEDDELLVEIETHFDRKGMKGDRKKKLISNLIEKIEKAIHTSSDNKKEIKNETVKYETKPKKHRHIHIKKRTQNPLNRIDDMILKNKMQIALDSMVHRQMDPIAKAVPLQEPMPYVSDQRGQDWQKKYYGPGFLDTTKSINSAEMSEVDVDYKTNGVYQRIQKPLNNEITVKDVTPNAYYDLGKLKFFVKDIAGSGFSVGFNQYVDEQPDPEAMKLFTGIENILQTYHQTYDQSEQAENEVEPDKTNEIHNESEDNYHTIARRSINNEHDHHSNEYRVVFENRHLPYDNYEDIFKDYNRNHWTRNSRTNANAIENDIKPKETFIFNEGMFDKNLKPAEIFGIADLLERRKRSINVHKISNLKNKIKLNRFLNTKTMASKRIFLSKKRNKRQTEKIRIIANDDMPMRKHSDEIFVFSDENVLADRAMVREVETPELEPRVVEDHYDVIQPESPISQTVPQPRMAQQPQMPYVYEEANDEPLVTNIFDGISRHNTLMSKYPHILLEEIGRSREEDIVENPVVFNKYIVHNQQIPAQVSTTPVPPISNVPAPKMEEIVKAITPQNAKTNYRVTVKILPKNVTGLNSGFKEIHTSINKSYNRNGLLYSSLVNVSEISKIVKINKTNENVFTTTTQSPVITNFRRKQETMNHILRQHKHRIEQQLHHLHREKEKLETLSMKNDTEIDYANQNEYFEVVVPSNPPKVLKLTRDELSRLAVASLVKIEEQMTTLPSTTAFTTSTTTELPQTTENTQIIDKMERNEKVTNEILKKIDKNTEILQIFLQKLTDKLVAKGDNKVKPDIENIQTFKNIPAPFNQMMPNMEATNDSHVSIPFIYAYQQPYTLPVNKPQVPVASVVYHGHIHTNTIRTKPEWPERDQKKAQDDRKTNQTKFFIDELENTFIAADVKKGFANLHNRTAV